MLQGRALIGESATPPIFSASRDIFYLQILSPTHSLPATEQSIPADDLKATNTSLTLNYMTFADDLYDLERKHQHSNPTYPFSSEPT